MLISQPPSGGCVLKLQVAKHTQRRESPAAFGRLCVETWFLICRPVQNGPAAFGRLCVETHHQPLRNKSYRPAAFGRLCVETLVDNRVIATLQPAAFGRLCVETPMAWTLKTTICCPAAFGRLCVETSRILSESLPKQASRLRAAVC